MLLVWGNSLQGQEVSRGRLGILLGGMNGVSYDYALTNHLELGGRAASDSVLAMVAHLSPSNLMA